MSTEKQKSPETPKTSDDYDLSRLKWINPTCNSRFIRREPKAYLGSSSEDLLQNIIHLADEIFNIISVLEQFPETSSRGATVDPEQKVDTQFAKKHLVSAQQELWELYRKLEEKRQIFVQQQLKSLNLNEETRGLKVQIGSGATPLNDWVNIDAGGADLTLNVNWGLMLPDECAEFVYSAHLVEHLRYNDQAPFFIREVLRILRKGGVVRFVLPDIRKLLVAYVERDLDFFKARDRFYPLSNGFTHEGIATLDYILLFSGAGPQLMNYNHKFGYDVRTFRKLLIDAGFDSVVECKYQQSRHFELRVDDIGYNAQTKTQSDLHYSLFVEAIK